MSRRRPIRGDKDDSSENNKKKKLVQTKLDVHFSFRASSTANSDDVGIMNEKDEEKPSTSGKSKQREEVAAAALMRATKISTNKNNEDIVDSFRSVAIALDQTPQEPDDAQDFDAAVSDARPSAKQHFWEEDDDDEAGRNDEIWDDDEDSSDSKSSGETQVTFLGIPLESLRKPPAPFGKLTAVRDKHTILFDTSSLENMNDGHPPKPYPRHHYDRWDGDHVRMPCSSRSEYPVNKTEVVSRWELVREALSKHWKSFEDLLAAILSYNDRYANKWNFSGLRKYIEDMDDDERDALFSTTLPKMAELALQLTELVTQPIPLLKRGMRQTITMTQQQAASLLANAFFCTYPRRNQRSVGSEYANYPEINFHHLFGPGQLMHSKLDFIFHYFRRVTTKMPEGVLSYERVSLDEFPDWSVSKVPLTQLHVSRKGTIEDFGDGMLQVDFANKFLGGGVLNYGSVQEEIRFLICPELIVSMLFSESLADNEAFLITGAERYSYYSGYASSLQWLRSFEDTTPRDEWGRRRVELVAMDAIPYHYNKKSQFKMKEIDRELNKVYCGFVRSEINGEFRSAVATGNWGCGAFGGDKDLKSLIQLLAAAEAGRDVAYFTFDDSALTDRIYDMYDYLVEQEFTVGDVYQLLNEYSQYLYSKPKKPFRLFKFIRRVDIV